MHRRSFLQAGAAASVLGTLPRLSFAQQLPFDPKPAGWRTFEITTRVENELTTSSTGAFPAAFHSQATIAAPYLPSRTMRLAPFPDQLLPMTFW